MTPHSDYSEREMVVQDLPQVLQIEPEAYPSPWSERIFLDCLSRRDQGYLCRTLQSKNNRVAGYAIVTLALEECELVNFCLHRDVRGQGLGHHWLRQVVSFVREQGACQIFLEVREGNTAAQRVYLEGGFSEIGRRKGYYPASLPIATRSPGLVAREDALIFGLMLS
ncbi:MAG TPA: ribosomal-protein-alanine N-acetyltransferase [Gammaproteobacteria bacterium]|nr:ribosomal-protein-alanine N-acetyltransferase [Gammaproteobacteria bacterium]